MSETPSSFDAVLDALPAVQKAVKKEISARLAAGEQIGTMQDSEMRERSKAVLAGTRSQRKSAA